VLTVAGRVRWFIGLDLGFALARGVGGALRFIEFRVSCVASTRFHGTLIGRTGSSGSFLEFSSSRAGALQVDLFFAFLGLRCAVRYSHRPPATRSVPPVLNYACGFCVRVAHMAPMGLGGTGKPVTSGDQGRLSRKVISYFHAYTGMAMPPFTGSRRIGPTLARVD